MLQSTVPAFFLPQLPESSLEQFVTLTFKSAGQPITLRSPRLTPTLLSMVTRQLKKAQRTTLSQYSVYDIVERLDEVATRWCDPSYPLRQEAEALLPAITSYSRPMIVHGLEALMSMLQKESLLRLLHAEFDDPRVLDQFRPRHKVKGMSRAYGPQLITHVFSGNVPGLAAFSLMQALLVKSASLGKSASEEPLFPVLFARSLSEVDPELAKCLAILWWKGGSEEIEGQAFAQSDTVIVYGGEQAVNSVHKRVPASTRFISYGHKLSFGIIAREYLAESNVKETAARAAYDTSIFDQQECLSPHVFYVEEGGAIAPKDFARYLAVEMEALNQQLPRGKISLGASAAINQLRGAYEFKEFEDDGVALHHSAGGTHWTVIYESNPTFTPSCLNRTIWVKPVPELADVPALVEPVKHYLQTVGFAVPKERLLPVADQLGQLGVDRLCPLGKMPDPSIEWHHDGRFNLLDLVRWTDIE